MRRMESAQRAFEHCAWMVREGDYVGYLCAAALPARARVGALAIRAFALETRQPTSRDAPLAQLRLEWWKQAVDDTYDGRPPSHPVALSIAALLEEQKEEKRMRLTRGWFKRIVDGRSEEVERGGNVPSLDELERQAERCVSAMHYLVLECAEVRHSAAHHAASHLGAAEGLVDSLRRAHVRPGAMPSSILAQFGASQEDIRRGENREALAMAAQEVAEQATAHIERGRALAVQMPTGTAKRALLPMVACAAWLNSLRKVNFDLFHPRLRAGSGLAVPPILLQARLWWNAFRETY